MYIGQTSRDIETRWREHISDAFGRDKKFNFAFHRAIKKYGEDAFILEQIEECDNEHLDERERYWIKHYNSYKNGYNSDCGGRSNRGRPIYQYALDGTFIRKFDTLGEAIQSINVKNIMLSSKRPQITIAGYLWSRKKVDKLNYAGNPKEKTVHQYSIDGKYIATYDSLTNAARAVCNRNTGTLIGSACRGERDVAYGFRWSFDKVDSLPEYIHYTHCKKVVRISPDGSNRKLYNSIKEAAADNNLFGSNIVEACKGRLNTCGGYCWKYHNEDNLENAI